MRTLICMLVTTGKSGAKVDRRLGGLRCRLETLLASSDASSLAGSLLDLYKALK